MTATGPMDISLEVANNWGDGLDMKRGRSSQGYIRNMSSFQRRQSKDHIEAARLRSAIDVIVGYRDHSQIAAVLIYRGIGHALRYQDHADGQTSDDIAS
jgi:hypothetical protein